MPKSTKQGTPPLSGGGKGPGPSPSPFKTLRVLNGKPTLSVRAASATNHTPNPAHVVNAPGTPTASGASPGNGTDPNFVGARHVSVTTTTRVGNTETSQSARLDIGADPAPDKGIVQVDVSIPTNGPQVATFRMLDPRADAPGTSTQDVNLA